LTMVATAGISVSYWFKRKSLPQSACL